MRQGIGVLIVLILALTAALWRQSVTQAQITNPQPAPSADELQAVTLIFGAKDMAPAKWDGSASISKGKIEKTLGYHFTDTSKILDGNAWECSTHPWAPFSGGMHPNEKPQPQPTPVEPIGITIEFRGPADADLHIKVPKGDFSFRPMDVPPLGGIFPLGATVEVYRTPVVEQITTEEYEDDYPSVAMLPDDKLVVTWQGYKDSGEHIFQRTLENGRWGERVQVTRNPGDIFMPAVSAGAIVWSERDGKSWHLKRVTRPMGEPESITKGEETNLFGRQAGGHVAYRKSRNGRGDIYVDQILVSDPKRHPRANDWNPAIAVDRSGTVWVAWDGYAEGSYNIYLRSVRNNRPGELIKVTNSSRFHAHPSLAIDSQNRIWIAWDEAPENWGKDVGFLFSGGSGLYESRAIRVAVYAGGKWLTPLRQPEEVVPYGYKRYFQTPRLVADSAGNIWLFARPRTSARLPTSLWAAGGKWEVVATYYNGDRWSDLFLIPGTQGRNEGGLDVAADSKGNVYVAAVTDHKLWGGPNFGHPPGNNDIVVAKLRALEGSTKPELGPRPPEAPGGLPSEPRERDQLAALRDYAIQVDGKTYKVYRGDMHRHTDISLDGAGDGSLWDAYRYAMDAANLDYFLVTDHQSGAQEYTWWRIEKSADMFHAPGFFTTFYGTERSLGYPNGHRNLVFARRGVRILPITPAEQKASTNSGAVLYPYLLENRGIAMSHTSHTNMGTDWRDNDPELEPLVELYQGARTSAEHEGALLSPTEKRTELWAGGYRPLGFVWNAWAKGYKLGVQASSDHVSTHLSYACVIAEDSTREALIDAMRKRHTYAATSNILLDYRMTVGGATYLQGDTVTEASSPPELWAKIVGTAPLKKLAVVRDNEYIYTQDLRDEYYDLRYRENTLLPGKHYYYVRVEQTDGRMAWSSPIWVTR